MVIVNTRWANPPEPQTQPTRLTNRPSALETLPASGVALGLGALLNGPRMVLARGLTPRDVPTIDETGSGPEVY